MTVKWTRGNLLGLLENGEAFFPAVFDAIRGAERSVMLETFIISGPVTTLHRITTNNEFYCEKSMLICL